VNAGNDPVNKVTRTADTDAQTPGVRFAAHAQPGSPQEHSLRRISAALSGGGDSPSAGTGAARLELNDVQVVDGSSHSIITLWVPPAQEPEAVAALRAEGFDIE
jgi:hypothetical protein